MTSLLLRFPEVSLITAWKPAMESVSIASLLDVRAWNRLRKNAGRRRMADCVVSKHVGIRPGRPTSSRRFEDSCT
ncbi:hypothetical protein DPMN_070031 [Dreissena polymorpha]|uniref:Uncharacterized protein n=1 Tax=Dreissena polymorpha TaxID=45954 RepID=A0A9D3Z4N2_DREPO|nr:hypothetical protein DPMN_070031 [Dreissena polymorpha]